MATKVEIKGLKKLLSKLDKLPKEMVTQLDGITEANARELEAKAKMNAPVGVSGALRQNGQTIKEDLLTWKVVFTAPYAGYVEFGTGTKVSVPNEFKDLANQWRNNPSNGSFEDGLQSIKDWCRAKGIPEEAAYPIFLKLLRVGQNAQPFLYPAFKSQSSQYIKDVEAYLTKKVKEI